MTCSHPTPGEALTDVTAAILRSAAQIIADMNHVARGTMDDDDGYDVIGAVRVAAGLPAMPFNETKGQAYGPAAQLAHEALCRLVRTFTPGFGNRYCDQPGPNSWGLPNVATVEREAGRWSDAHGQEEIVDGLRFAANGGAPA
jgi:hypothetical protein